MSTKKNKIYFFTGAGISAPSGIPTFRDKGGIWDVYDVDEVCNINTWKVNRDKVYDFFTEINNKYSKAKPNDAHKFVSNIQNDFGSKRVKIITQNVDNLFEDAGCTDVLHLHGKIGYMHCTNCSKIWEDEIDKEIKCSNCKSNEDVKPYVTMFGEHIPNYSVFRKILKKLKKDDIFVIIGTNGKVVDPSDILPPKKKYTKYWQTNYILNVMDEDHFFEIPSNPDFYGIESCIDFLPKIKEFIYKQMIS